MNKIVVPVVVVIAILAGVGVWWFSRAQTPAGADELSAAAGRFSAPTEWTFLDETKRDSGSVCIDATCPSFVRRWQSAEPPSADALTDLMQRAGWTDVAIEGHCQPQSNRTGAFPLCRATASAQGQRVDISVTGLSGNVAEPYLVSMLVTR